MNAINPAELDSAVRDPVISLQGVRKQFGSHRVIDNLSFDVREGELVTLLGRTGAGKTTVLSLIMGMTRPDAGSVTVAGYDPFRQFKQLKGRLAVSFQTDRLLPWRTAVENAELGLLILGGIYPSAAGPARARVVAGLRAGAQPGGVHLGLLETPRAAQLLSPRFRPAQPSGSPRPATHAPPSTPGEVLLASSKTVTIKCRTQ